MSMMVPHSLKNTRAWSMRNWSWRHSRFMGRCYGVLLAAIRIFKPVLKLRALEPPIRHMEAFLKGVLFDCRMCGNCILSSTGMSCCMNCPKNMRNGPCGGISGGEQCEIKPEMRCVWLDAWDGSKAMSGGKKIQRIQKPLNAQTIGRSTWVALARADHDISGADDPDFNPAEIADPTKRVKTGKPGALERKLISGAFCITTEYTAPDTANAKKILNGARPMLAVCDSVNVTDGPSANTHIASQSVCALLARDGADPVMQISCRDRNSIAMQADALGAAALGIKNILCLSGDGIHNGDQPDAKPVNDLDCTSLLAILKTMRNESCFASGRNIDEAPGFFLGATSNPCVIRPDVEVERIAKKIRAGAQFIQTQYIYDMPAFREFFKRFTDRGLHETCYYLAGVGPLPSARSARWRRSNIAGVRVPDNIIARLEGAKKQKREGLKICIETIQELREITGIAGVHIMAFGQSETIGEIIEKSGIKGRVLNRPH